MKSPRYEYFCEITICVPKWNFKHSFVILAGFDTLIVILSAFIMVLTKVDR